MLGPRGRFPERRLIVEMNSLNEFFGSGQTIPWIETQNAVAFLRPMPDVGVGTPSPTARVAESLRFGQVRFAAPEGFLGSLLFAQIEDEHNALVRTLKPGASNQHGHASAVFPEILLLICLKNPGCQELFQGTFVAFAPLGR